MEWGLRLAEVGTGVQYNIYIIFSDSSGLGGNK